MKRERLMRWLGAAMIFAVVFTMTSPIKAKATPAVGVSFQVFYDGLSPYGDWVDDPRYGYIWLPHVGPNFHPYGTNGHWVMTQFGNTWVSNYDWGWAPFHYGRWFFDDYYGWAWVPGYEWGPAWVNWRTGGGYYGWAPLGPGVSVNVRVNIPSFHWVFVSQRRFTSRNIWRYYAPRTRVVNIYRQTTVINNTYVHNKNVYVSGPNRRDIQRVSRRAVPVYQVNNSPKAGRSAIQRNNLNVYRPEVRADNRSQARPSRITSVQNARASRTALGNKEAVSPRSRTAVSGRNQNTSARPAVRSGNNASQVNRGNSTRPARQVNTSPSRQKQPATVKAQPQQQRQQVQRSNSRQAQPKVQQNRTQTQTVKQSPAVKSNNKVNTKSSRSTVSRSSSPSVRQSNSRSSQVKSTSSASSRRTGGTTSRSASRSRGNN